MLWKTSAYLRILPLPGKEEVIIYHSLCGNPVVASPDTIKLLDFFRKPQEFEAAVKRGVQPTILELFRRNSFLVPDGNDERTKLHEIAKARRDLATSGGLVTHLRFFSAYCNFACSYCSITHLNQLGHERMISLGSRFPWSTAKLATETFLNLVNAHGHQLVRIRFFGGEPLLDWKVYQQVIEYVEGWVHRPRVEFYLNTNGSLITPEIATFLKTHCIRTIISLDGVEEVHNRFRIYPSGKGTYRSVWAGIELLREAGVELHINITINTANIDHLRETIDLCKEIGAYDVGVEDLCFINCLSSAFMVEVERQKAAIIDAWRYGRQIGISVRGSWTGFRSLSDYTGPINYCAGAGEEICINHEGKVFPCFGIPLPIGTIDRLDECFHHPLYQAMALRVTGNIPDCRGCEIEGPCGGGCAADAFAATHNVSSIAHEKCEMRRAIAKQLLIEQARVSI